jgi:hypothetical protein
LVALTVVITAGSAATDRAAFRTHHSVELAAAYCMASGAINEEESIERAYRLQPSAATWAAHQAARASLDMALDQVTALGTTRDFQVVSQVRLEQSTYDDANDGLVAAIAQGARGMPANRRQVRRVESTYRVMDAQLDEAVNRTRDQSLTT